jgi:hypothetical protein
MVLLIRTLTSIMSLPVNKKAGLILLSALLIFSCNKKEQIGLELQPQDQVGVFFTDTLTVNTYAFLKNDSIVTSNLSYVFAGAYDDPEFGDVSAEGYMQLLLKSETTSTVSAIVDSVVLSLTYDYHYGDTNQFQTINVYKLTEALVPDSTYFSINAPLAKDPTNIDTDVAFKAKPGTSQIVNIPLTNAFGSEILTINGAGTTNANFLTQFNGLALLPKNPDEGAVLRFKLFDNTSKVKIYYDGNPDPFELLINSSSARFSRLTSNRGSIPDLVALNSSYDEFNTSGKAYIQSGLGIKTKVTFPTLTHFKNSLGNIAINRAELVLEVDPATIGSFLPVEILNLVKLDSTGKIQKFKDIDNTYQDVRVQKDGFDLLTNTIPLQVAYNSISSEYTFNISSYIHSLIYGVQANNGLLISPNPLDNVFTVNRVLAGSGSKKVKMRIYYTLIN